MTQLMDVLEAAAYVSFVLGASFAIYQLRIMARDRQTKFIMQVGQFVCSKDFQEPLCKIWETSAQDAKELENEVSYLGLSMIGDYFEGISSLVRRGLVRENLALEAYALDVLWKKMSPWIIALRTDNPGLYKGFEDLARRRALRA